MGHSLLTSSTMKVAIVVLAFLAAAGAQPMDPKFTCSECVHEMHQLGWMVKYAAEDIHNYLVANYCPTTGDPSCPENLSWYYVGMLHAVVQHFIVDGAVHICQTMMECGAKKYTCEECIYGLEYVERYLEDDIIINEMVVYLQQSLPHRVGKLQGGREAPFRRH